MTDKSSLRIHRIVGAAVAASIVIAGICLAAGCCYIYFSEGVEYSRSTVGDVFAAICIPVYLCLAFTVAGFVFELLLPTAKTAKAKNGTSEHLLENMLKKRNADALSDNLLSVHYREKGKRTLNSIIMTVLTAASCAVFFVYSLDSSNFDSVDINGSVINAMYLLIPCVALPFLFYVYLLISKERGFKREIALLKQESSDPKAVGAALEHRSKFEGFELFVCRLGRFFETFVSGNRIWAIRIVIIAIAFLCLVFGLVFGGTSDVFTKASNICTECIGLG